MLEIIKGRQQGLYYSFLFVRDTVGYLFRYAFLEIRVIGADSLEFIEQFIFFALQLLYLFAEFVRFSVLLLLGFRFFLFHKFQPKCFFSLSKKFLDFG